jgi:protein TonB
VPVDNGAPAGRYTVVLSFIVDKSGNISEINAENDPGYGTKEEAMRVLKKVVVGNQLFKMVEM